MSETPKSYLSEQERQERLTGGMTQNGLYAVESYAAGQAGDEEASWAWLALAEIPAHTLLAFKRTNGAEWIREKGLLTKTAEEAYGKDWLEREI